MGVAAAPGRDSIYQPVAGSSRNWCKWLAVTLFPFAPVRYRQARF